MICEEIEKKLGDFCRYFRYDLDKEKLYMEWYRKETEILLDIRVEDCKVSCVSPLGLQK